MTKEERAWVRKMNKLLGECPNPGWGFYTIGDHEVTIYDRTALLESGHYDENDDLVDCIGAAESDGHLIEIDELRFPKAVEGVCG